MQVLDWLNENAYRAYPLQASYTKTIPVQTIPELPDNFLLDLQIVTNTPLDQETVNLATLKRTSTHLEVEFIKLADTVAVFKLPSPRTVAYPYYLRTEEGSLAVFGEGARELYDAFNNSTNLTGLNIPVEPCTIIEYSGPWLGVSSLSCSPEKMSYTGLQSENSYKPALPITSVPLSSIASMTGDVQLLEGYNMRVNFSKGLIDLEAGSSFGLKMTCASSFLPPECLDCDELVSYINGVPPDAEGNFRLVEGSNIAITEGTSLAGFSDPFTEAANQHSLFVGLTFQATDLCAPVNITPTS